MTTLDRINRERTALYDETSGLSLDEIRALREAAADLRRDGLNPRGCLHRFNTPRSRSLVAHFNDEPTAERDPIMAAREAVTP